MTTFEAAPRMCHAVKALKLMNDHVYRELVLNNIDSPVFTQLRYY